MPGSTMGRSSVLSKQAEGIYDYMPLMFDIHDTKCNMIVYDGVNYEFEIEVLCFAKRLSAHPQCVLGAFFLTKNCKSAITVHLCVQSAYVCVCARVHACVCVSVCVRVSERQTDRQTGRQTDRRTDKQVVRDRDSYQLVCVCVCVCMCVCVCVCVCVYICELMCCLTILEK